MRFILCLIAVLSIISCSDKSEQKYKVLHYNQPNHITSLDPAFAKSQNNIWSVHHLFNGLVKLDDDLNVIPDIASQWNISEDGMIYTFFLKSNVKFHEHECLEKEGRTVIAEDFVYSFSRLLDPKVSSPGSWLFSDKLMEEDPFSAPNDTTFIIRLNKPFIPLMGILTMQYCSVVPRECVDSDQLDFRIWPIGTGPFKMKKWIQNQALFLVRNEDYFESNDTNSLPILDGVRTSFIPDRKIAFLELLSGRMDFVSGLESSFINELLDSEGNLKAKHDSTIQYIKAPYLNMEYLGINLTATDENSPLRKKEFRKALNYAIDRPLMLRSLRNNVGLPASGGFVPVGLPSFNDSIVKGYYYHPDTARILMAEAGYPNGKGLTPLELYTNKDYLDLTTFIAKQWESIGIPSTIEVLESAILRDGMRKAQLPLFRASWIADYPDAESFLCMFYGPNPAPPNYTRFGDDRFDKLYEKAISESDRKSRFQLYHEMDQMLIEEAPVVFLFYDQTALFASKKIRNLSSNALNLLNVTEVDEILN